MGLKNMIKMMHISYLCTSFLCAEMHKEKDVFIDDNATVADVITAQTGQFGCGISVGCDATVDGTVFVGNDLNVSGDALIGGTIYIDGDNTVSGNQMVYGTITSSEIDSSNAILYDASVCNLFVGCDLEVNTNATISGNVSVSGDQTIDGTIFIGGDIGLNGNAIVSGIGSFGDTLIANCDTSIGCNLYMNDSVDSAHGNIMKNGMPFMHNFPGSGNNNIFLGQNSGNFALIGTDNIGIGTNALANLSSGSMNIAIGSNAGNVLTFENGNILLGSSGIIGDTDTIRIGDTQTNAFIQGVFAQAVDISTGIPIFVDASGKLGTLLSSIRFKKNIRSISAEQALSIISKLHPVLFSYNQDVKNIDQFGLIAEEVARICPSLVVRDDHNEPLAIRYEQLHALVISVLQNCCETQQKCIQENKDLKRRVETLEKYIGKIAQYRR